MKRELFKDGKIYALDERYGGGHSTVFHAGPCVAITCSIDNDIGAMTFDNPVQVVNFFYPAKEEHNRILIKLGDKKYYAYDVSKIQALIDCNDNWLECLVEKEEQNG